MTYTDHTSPTQESLQQAQTSCKDCIFAIWQNNTQVGCDAGRIDIYQQQGSIIEAYDEDKEFYVINNRICNHCRNQAWLDKHVELKDTSIEQQLEYVRKEVSLGFQIIVLAGNSLDDIKKTIHPLLQDEYEPALITIIRKIDCTIRPSTLRLYLDTLKIKWRIESIVDPTLDEREMIDLAVNSANHGYYITVRAGTALPVNYLSNLDKLWNDKLIQLGIVIIDDQDIVNGMMVCKAIHTYMQGNEAFDLEYKVKEFNDTIIYKYGDLI